MGNNYNSLEEISAIEQKLIRLEQQLQATYNNVGKKFLILAENEQQKINNLVDSIIKTRKSLTEEKKEIQCPNCMTFNIAESQFCRQCGKSIKSKTLD